ncbi:DUF4889 domain-containing protein [Staphylococcus sp. SQ8-PEA]|uniref:DUF4889 domain-containing protein n=1 Tax=Staphylococcus marylandisciuri TaxID=2981529 RepID=A0ABT2QMU5_9STAP|nr:DUF4889 domain-containing protein [Staphylococcus marylandisciuri]MCU5745280.1 DUF4889 domain-containing protein [Staphylococcus marylandisciuri]
MTVKGKGLAIILSAIMIIVSIVLVIIMLTTGEKEIYYGYMKDNHTAEKMVNAKTHKVTKNVKLHSESGFSPKKGDFVKLSKSEGDDKFDKMKVVKHDDVPHELMMKIHDMHMKGM